MSQILIIDVQSNFSKFYSECLPENIKDACINFSQSIYLFDSTDGDSISDVIPYEFAEDEDFYDSLTILEKQYGFFRGLMDYGIDEEDIVDAGKFMIANGIWDWTSIENNEAIEEKFKKKFKNTEFLEMYEDSRDGYSFWIPDDLLDSLRTYIANGVTLVGGGTEQCLKEISLFLDMLDINYTIDQNLTY